MGGCQSINITPCCPLLLTIIIFYHAKRFYGDKNHGLFDYKRVMQILGFSIIQLSFIDEKNMITIIHNPSREHLFELHAVKDVFMDHFKQCWYANEHISSLDCPLLHPKVTVP